MKIPIAIGLIMLFLAAPGLPQDPQAAPEAFKFKVDVALVTADVTVQGSAVPALRAEDFVLYDEGVAQQISHFSRDQLPLAVAVLIDGSLSIQPYLPVLQIASLSALRRLKPEDQVVLFSFNMNTSRHSDLTEDRAQIARKIGSLKVAFGTRVYGTIYDASRYLKKHAPNRRHAIVLISDNCNVTYSGPSAADARTEALETATTVYAIKTPGDSGWGQRAVCSEHNAQVKRIAEETGGEMLDVRGTDTLQSALEKAISTLRLQYTLGFNPSTPGVSGSFHKLTIKPADENTCPRCQILARSGYYVGKSAPVPIRLSSATSPPSGSAKNTDDLLVQRSIMTAGTVDADLPDIPFTVNTAEQMDSNGQPQIQVDLLIDFAKVAFKSVEDRHACRLRVTIFYADSKGKILGSEWKTIEGQLKQETYEHVMRSGIAYSATVPKKAQKQIIKIVIYDEESDKVGSKLIRMP